MNQTYLKKYQKPNYNDIQKAKNEDQEAIQKIISIYQPNGRWSGKTGRSRKSAKNHIVQNRTPKTCDFARFLHIN